MASSNKYDIDNLKELKNKIMQLQENEYYEILKIIIKNNFNYSENKNGVFINMTKLSPQIIEELEKMVVFCENNKIRLNNDSKVRNNLLQNFNKN